MYHIDNEFFIRKKDLRNYFKILFINLCMSKYIYLYLKEKKITIRTMETTCTYILLGATKTI